MPKQLSRCLIPLIACLSSGPLLADTATDTAPVSIETCLNAAYEIVPGGFVKVEFLDPSAEHIPAYEIDLITDNGKEFKVEVDAASGAIIEMSVERWQIGEEDSERR